VYPAYQLFLRGDVQVDDKNAYEEITPLGFSRQPFLYPCLLKQDSIWMSVTPFEIETMKNTIRIAKGNVLTLGCGMGYVALMMSQKADVRSVTIVEKDLVVLTMFEQHILPQIPHRHKIKLIHQDAFDYLGNTFNLDNVEMVFVDIYQTVEDGLPLYLKFKKIEANTNSHITWTYWLEASMLAMIRREYIVHQTISPLKNITMNDLSNRSINQALLQSFKANNLL
jgi:hypothetical protein